MIDRTIPVRHRVEFLISTDDRETVRAARDAIVATLDRHVRVLPPTRRRQVAAGVWSILVDVEFAAEVEVVPLSADATRAALHVAPTEWRVVA